MREWISELGLIRIKAWIITIIIMIRGGGKGTIKKCSLSQFKV